MAAIMGVAMLSSASRSEAQSCTAALDVDLHYCLPGVPGGMDCAGVNTSALQAGDEVTLTMEVTNDSQFQPPGLNPPAGVLQGPSTAGLVPPPAEFLISYACSVSTCLPAEVLAVFTFNSATVLPGAGGNATFTDNGNGTGTLKVTNAGIPYASTDPGKLLVQIKLTVANPLPDGALVFARANGNQTAFLVKDAGCFAGLTGTGQGSTAARFGGTITGCGNTGTITLPSLTGKPQGTANVALRANDTGQMFDGPSEGVILTVSNANGVCFSQNVPVNSPGWTNPNTYSNPDPAVRQCKQPGIKSITFRNRASHGGQIQIRVESCGNTDPCNLAGMTTTVMVGNDTFTQSGTWRGTPQGWRFP